MQFQARPSPHTTAFGLLCTSFNRVVIQQIFREWLLCARPGAGCIKVNQTAINTALQSLRGAQHRRPPYVLKTLSLSCTDSLSLPSGKDTLGCGYLLFWACLVMMYLSHQRAPGIQTSPIQVAQPLPHLEISPVISFFFNVMIFIAAAVPGFSCNTQDL